MISSSTHGSVLSWSYKSCDYFRYPADVRAVDAILSLIVFPFIKFCSVVMGVRQWCAVGGWLVAVCLFAARTAPGSAASDVVGVHRMSGLLRTSPHPDGERPAASSTAMPRQRLILLTGFFGVASRLTDTFLANKRAYASSHGLRLVDAYEEAPPGLKNQLQSLGVSC